MDRRTGEAKQIGNSIAERLRADIDKSARAIELEYIKAERCRICGLDRSDLPHSTHVREVIDRELMSNATYRGAIDAAEPFIAGWPPDQRPTYAAVRNHAKRHLNRDQALMRQLMETYAVNTGIDIEESEGPILTPGGVLAVIAQKGYEQVRDRQATPTIGDTIAASRALIAMDREALLAALEEERGKVRLLMTALREASAFDSQTSSPSESRTGGTSSVIILPEEDASDPTGEEEVSEGYSCDECATVAKTKRGLTQHKRWKHADRSQTTTG
jgi:hypothetical protein